MKPQTHMKESTRRSLSCSSHCAWCYLFPVTGAQSTAAVVSNATAALGCCTSRTSSVSAVARTMTLRSISWLWSVVEHLGTVTALVCLDGWQPIQIRQKSG